MDEGYSTSSKRTLHPPVHSPSVRGAESRNSLVGGASDLTDPKESAPHLDSSLLEDNKSDSDLVHYHHINKQESMPKFDSAPKQIPLHYNLRDTKVISTAQSHPQNNMRDLTLETAPAVSEDTALYSKLDVPNVLTQNHNNVNYVKYNNNNCIICKDFQEENKCLPGYCIISEPPQWNVDSAKVGKLTMNGNIKQRFTKQRKGGMISLIYEENLRVGGVHAYRYSIVEGQISAADGVGFVFAGRVPCGKNIQTLWSVFVNRHGQICKRKAQHLEKRTRTCLAPLETGCSVNLLIDLDRFVALFQMSLLDGTETNVEVVDFADMNIMSDPPKCMIRNGDVDNHTTSSNVNQMVSHLPTDVPTICSSGYFCVVVTSAPVTVLLSHPVKMLRRYVEHVRNRQNPNSNMHSLPPPSTPIDYNTAQSAVARITATASAKSGHCACEMCPDDSRFWSVAFPFRSTFELAAHFYQAGILAAASAVTAASAGDPYAAAALNSLNNLPNHQGFAESDHVFPPAFLPSFAVTWHKTLMNAYESIANSYESCPYGDSNNTTSNNSKVFESPQSERLALLACEGPQEISLRDGGESIDSKVPSFGNCHVEDSGVDCCNTKSSGSAMSSTERIIRVGMEAIQSLQANNSETESSTKCQPIGYVERSYDGTPSFSSDLLPLSAASAPPYLARLQRWLSQQLPNKHSEWVSPATVMLENKRMGIWHLNKSTEHATNDKNNPNTIPVTKAAWPLPESNRSNSQIYNNRSDGTLATDLSSNSSNSPIITRVSSSPSNFSNVSNNSHFNDTEHRHTHNNAFQYHQKLPDLPPPPPPPPT